MTKTERLSEMQNQVKELQKNIEIMKKEIEDEKLIFTFDGFDSGKFSVNCRTENDANIFLAYLQGKGYKWCEGIYPLSKNRWNEYKDKTCYEKDEFGEKRLCYCDLNYFERRNGKIIQFNIEMLKS